MNTKGKQKNRSKSWMKNAHRGRRFLAQMLMIAITCGSLPLAVFADELGTAPSIGNDNAPAISTSPDAGSDDETPLGAAPAIGTGNQNTLTTAASSNEGAAVGLLSTSPSEGSGSGSNLLSASPSLDNGPTVTLSTSPSLDIGSGPVLLSVSPSTGTSLSTSPSIDSMSTSFLSASPSLDNGVIISTSPSTGSGANISLSASPSSGIGSATLSASPSLDNGSASLSASPSIGNGQTNTLSTSPSIASGLGLSASPSLDSGAILSTSPSIGSGLALTASPSIDNGASLGTSPSIDSGAALTTSPSIGVSLSTSPSVGSELTTSPSIGVSLSTSPSVGSELTTSPSVANEGGALTTSPSIASQGPALSSSPSIGSEPAMVSLSASPSIDNGGDSAPSLSTSPSIASEPVVTTPVLLTTSPSTGGGSTAPALTTSPSIGKEAAVAPAPTPAPAPVPTPAPAPAPSPAPAGGGGGGGGGGGSILLLVTNPSACQIAPGVFEINWYTSYPATTRVAYGTASVPTTGSAPLYGYQNTTEKQSALSTQHKVVISGLRPDTPYFFRPLSGFLFIGSSETVGQEVTPANCQTYVAATYAPVQPLSLSASCPYLTEYLGAGFANTPEQVFRLQNFLRVVGGYDVGLTGVYDAKTTAAVHNFQNAHYNEVLLPWGAGTKSTGYVYITTRAKINEMMGCGGQLSPHELSLIRSYDIQQSPVKVSSPPVQGPQPVEPPVIIGKATSTQVATVLYALPATTTPAKCPDCKDNIWMMLLTATITKLICCFGYCTPI